MPRYLNLLLGFLVFQPAISYAQEPARIKQSIQAEMVIKKANSVVMRQFIAFSEHGLKVWPHPSYSQYSRASISNFQTSQFWVLDVLNKKAFEIQASQKKALLKSGLMATAPCKRFERREKDRLYTDNSELNIEKWSCIDNNKTTQLNWYSKKLGIVTKVVKVSGTEEYLQNIKLKGYKENYFKPNAKFTVIQPSIKLESFHQKKEEA